MGLTSTEYQGLIVTFQAPFKLHEVNQINTEQQNPRRHAKTCMTDEACPGCTRRTQETEGILKATTEGMICPCSEYTENDYDIHPSYEITGEFMRLKATLTLPLEELEQKFSLLDECGSEDDSHIFFKFNEKYIIEYHDNADNTYTTLTIKEVLEYYNS